MDDVSAPREPASMTGPDASRAALLRELAGVEAAIRQAEATRSQIGQAAASLRDHAQADIMALEEQGITSQDRQERYRQALDGRRRCDLVSRMIEDPTHEEAL